MHDRLSAAVEGIAPGTCRELDPGTGQMWSGGSLAFNHGTNLIALLQARCGRFPDAVLVGSNAAVFAIGTGVGGALPLGADPPRVALPPAPRGRR